ncbi:MAG: lipopolysaccharide kinase InaA family protein [Propionivibrio sp.]
MTLDAASGSPATFDTAALRTAGRTPATPFSVRLADGSVLRVDRLLRVLPGKRIVGDGEWNGRHVLAKLFVAAGSERHWKQEKDGIDALRAAGVPTPDILLGGALPGDGYLLLTSFIDDALTLADAWRSLAASPAGSTAVLDMLRPALHQLGHLHAAGLVQDDLHLGNFLRRGDDVWLIDGDAVRSISPGKALDERSAGANLAILLAQLPLAWDACRQPLLDAYVAGGGRRFADPAVLDGEVSRIRDWRLKDFLGKTLRDCTLFAVVCSVFRFSAVRRSETDSLQPVMAAPDAALRDGMLLKDGRTSTVARVVSGERVLVVKRYNLKNLRHALTRFWRPSRAWHAWREGHRLAFYGIATPDPLALIEERVGPLRRRAFLFTEHCPGVDLLRLLSPDVQPSGDMAQAIVALFEGLHDLRISHGDLKATNLLWHDGKIFLIDLDAMQQHRSPHRHAAAWRRDRERLLRNWPPPSALYRWLDANLPVAR